MAAPEAKPEPKEVEDDAEPALTYKTWVLKVSIHCEACKRKVKRILKNVEGVYETDIDLKQQKVTVKGNVESETLIKKLLKTGKHAELWPETADPKPKKKSKSKKKEKQFDSESSDDSSGQEDDKEKLKLQLQIQNGDNAAVGKAPNGGGGVQPVAPPAGDGQKSGEGVKKKKKKKKKKKNAGGEASGDAPANTGSAPGPIPGHPEPGSQPGPSPVTANDSPPRHFVTQYPPHFFAPPIYSVRYSTAYAASSPPQSASYYATSRPYSYAYVHPGARVEIDPVPSDYEMYSTPPSDSLEIFSDENPNGCLLM